MFNQIQFNLLTVSPENVRIFSSDKKADKELKAMILKMGVLQNLVVHPLVNGNHAVVAGGRRFAAIKELVEENIFPSDYMIPVREVPLDADATAISLAENMGRASMNPADEYIAFSKMADKGASIEDISLTFGVTKKLVKQRMKLGNVATAVLDQFRESKMSLECLMSFTVTDDQERQLACLAQFSEQRIWPNQIKEFLLNDAVTSTNRWAKFVGKSAYKKAGGATSTDLFDEKCYFLDAELVRNLGTKKLEQSASEILKLNEWLWVKIAACEEDRMHIQKDVIPQWRHFIGVPQSVTDTKTTLIAKIDSTEDAVDKERLEDELGALEERMLAKYFNFSKEQKSYSGVLLSVDRGGKLEVQYGLARHSDIPKVDCSGESDLTSSIGVDDQKSDISRALNDDLGQYRQQITQAALLSNGELALDVLYYELCSQLLTSSFGGSHLVEASFRRVHCSTTLEDHKTGRAFNELEQAKNLLNTDWLASERDDRFKAFQSLSTEEKLKLVTFCTSQMLIVKVKGRNAEMDDIVEQLDVPFCDYWQATKANYFQRVTKNKLLLEFEDELQTLPVNSKKSTYVEFLNQCTGSQGDTNRPWIPEQF